MIIRVTKSKSGLSQYLKSGKRADSSYSRDDKDMVIPISGDLDIFEQTENYLNREKNYKNNYLHITVSFSMSDLNTIYDEQGNINYDILKDIVSDTVKHYTSGYDIDNEVIYYAEHHAPKIKVENGKVRLDHIHIGIALHNPLTNTQLRPPFFHNAYMNDTLQTYIAKKYHLDLPIENQRKEKNFETEIKLERKVLIEKLKDITTKAELEQFFEQNNIEYKEIKTKKNHYIKIIKKDGKNINLRGKGFEHIENIVRGKRVKRESIAESNRQKSVNELESELLNYYQKRVKEIDIRRSKKAKNKIREIYNNNNNKYNNIETLTFQQKLLYKHYKTIIENIGKGYYIKVENNKAKIKNKNKNIDIEDKGNIITAKGENLQEQIKIMLDLAEAKGWDLKTIIVNGSEDFKNETYKQIEERLELKQNLTITAKAVATKKQERPKSEVQYKQQERQEHKQAKKYDIDIKTLKEKVSAELILKYAIEKYKLNADDYEIIDNKINNKNNKQKPKNIIDFLTKECKIKLNEAVEIGKDIYYNQPINIHITDSNYKKEKENNMPLKISICESKNINAVDKWKVIEVSNYIELATLMKEYSYSATQFDNGYRNSDNANSFNNLLIYDIDNDKDMPQLTIKEAEQKLKQAGISAMILPSKSHNKDKNGHVAERYRIVIPTNRAIKAGTDKETYREFQQLTAKALKIDKYVDTKALNDKARFYYKSPISAEPIVIKASRVMSIDNLEAKAIERVKQRKTKRERELLKLKEIQTNVINVIKHKTMNIQQNIENLSYANVEKIMNTQIEWLIRHYEKPSKEYRNGSYDYLATNKTFKYSILKKDNLAHDFIANKTYNSLTYLMKIYQTNNVMQIARELERVTGESYTEVNYKAVEKTINNALNSAKNDKELEETIKKQFKVKYCKLEKDSIKIADKEINFNDINMQKIDIINRFRENREACEQQQQQQLLM